MKPLILGIAITFLSIYFLFFNQNKTTVNTGKSYTVDDAKNAIQRLAILKGVDRARWDARGTGC